MHSHMSKYYVNEDDFILPFYVVIKQQNNILDSYTL